jgi:hypothetical protein
MAVAPAGRPYPITAEREPWRDQDLPRATGLLFDPIRRHDARER